MWTAAARAPPPRSASLRTNTSPESSMPDSRRASTAIEVLEQIQISNIKIDFKTEYVYSRTFEIHRTSRNKFRITEFPHNSKCLRKKGQTQYQQNNFYKEFMYIIFLSSQNSPTNYNSFKDTHET